MNDRARELALDVADTHTMVATWLEEVGELGDACAAGAAPELHARCRLLLAFLEDVVLPHLAEEEVTVYPEVAGLIGAATATSTMVRDHVEIRHLTSQIARNVAALSSAVGPAARLELVGLLHGLRAVLSLHLAKEDELYLPLLLRSGRSTTTLEALQASLATSYVDGLTADGG